MNVDWQVNIVEHLAAKEPHIFTQGPVGTKPEHASGRCGAQHLAQGHLSNMWTRGPVVQSRPLDG